MALATGSRVQILRIKESTYATIPGTPTMLKTRRTGDTFELKRTPLQSAEIRADRQIADFRLGTAQIIGDLDFELGYGEFDDLIANSIAGVWTTEASGTPNTLIAGVTKGTFAFEKGFLDIGQYQQMRGCNIDSLMIDIKPSKIVTVKMAVFGHDMGTSTATVATGTAGPLGFPPFDAFSGTIKEGGSTIAIMTGLTIDIKNTDEAAWVIGSEFMTDYFPGRINITGTVTAWFQDQVLLNKFINETSSSVDLVLNTLAPADATLEIFIPKLKYTGGKTDVTQERGIPLTLPFQALLDTVTGTNIKFTRSNPADAGHN